MAWGRVSHRKRFEVHASPPLSKRGSLQWLYQSKLLEQCGPLAREVQRLLGGAPFLFPLTKVERMSLLVEQYKGLWFPDFPRVHSLHSFVRVTIPEISVHISAKGRVMAWLHWPSMVSYNTMKGIFLRPVVLFQLQGWHWKRYRSGDFPAI